MTTLPPAALTLKAIEDEQRRRNMESQPEVAKRFRDDPLGFVMYEWPWGQAGTPLEDRDGPDDLQRAFLDDLGKEIRSRGFTGKNTVSCIYMSIASAVGTGKSTVGGWLTWFILITRPNSIGTVTAGNYDQLEQRTWADIKYWGALARHGHEFDIMESGIFHKKNPDKWKVTPKTAAVGKSQSFAGQHAVGSTSWAYFDEASEVPEDHWKAMYGCLGDQFSEPMMFAWGQPLKNAGEFHAVTFGNKVSGHGGRWNARSWDGRLSKWSNKENIADWLEEYGEDSDFYRVRVLGLPPRASSIQFITTETVDAARKREHRPLADEPLLCGFDAANGGMAKFVFAFRCGFDAKSIPPIEFPGDTPRETVVAAGVDIMTRSFGGRRVAAMFGDQAFGAVILERIRTLSRRDTVMEVNFGGDSRDKIYKNTRGYIWGQTKEWLRMGAIPDVNRLVIQLSSPGFHIPEGSNKIVLESKQSMAKRGVASPDYGDALACTFFMKVAPAPPAPRPQQRLGGSMGFVR